jgi:hypothetical protein
MCQSNKKPRQGLPLPGWMVYGPLGSGFAPEPNGQVLKGWSLALYYVLYRRNLQHQL